MTVTGVEGDSREAAPPGRLPLNDRKQRARKVRKSEECERKGVAGADSV